MQGAESPNGAGKVAVKTVSQAVVEIVSDSGEGAQKAGQSFGALSAKHGNGVWTVEIIPAEIKPPARSVAGASGIRIRLGSSDMTNMGDEADIVVAFNEQVLYGRISNGAYRPGTVVLLENKWANDPVEEIRKQYATGLKMLKDNGYVVHELALDDACKEITPNPRLGKNMFVLGMLCYMYGRELKLGENEISYLFRRKGEKVVKLNHKLLHAGFAFAQEHVPYRYEIPVWEKGVDKVVMNGNQAIALGIMAAGIETMAMYPITPATSVSHHLGDAFPSVGGFMHQSEDEIAAVSFAIGASYAGKTAATVSSGPGIALKSEMLGLSVMAEVPLVVVNVQRGGPSTGLPTKVEQGDLFQAIFAQHGDAPRIVMACATHDDCFYMPIQARKLAEDFRTLVMILSDTNLATGVTSFPRPVPTADWLAPPIDQSDWDPNVRAYEWDETTGLSKRPIPGQRGGGYVLTGLAHDEYSHVAYDPSTNERSLAARSHKIAALRKAMKPPKVQGAPEGDLLVIGWGSTYGALTEAVERATAEGLKVGQIHLRFLSPLEPGLKDIMKRYKKVVCFEMNYADDPTGPLMDDEWHRPSQLAMMLRANTLVDVGSWTQVQGRPLAPGRVLAAIRKYVGATAAAAK